MLRAMYMYGVNGEISDILSSERAIIRFYVNGECENALLKNCQYYHNGKRIPANASLFKYLRFNMQVQFSCYRLDKKAKRETIDGEVLQVYNWDTIMCWTQPKDEINTEISITSGLVSAAGNLCSITKRHGILIMLDSLGTQHRVTFLASRFYDHGKRFPSSKDLSTQFNIGDKLLFDAIPCIPEESKDYCRWFATCAFQGKRPKLPQSMEEWSSDFQANNDKQLEKRSKDSSAIINSQDTQGDHLSQYQIEYSSNIRSHLLKITNQYTNNPRTLFTSGYGYILGILNDEFGIILGSFKKNVFETILFHRKNAFLFKVPLARANLTEIFFEGDRMRFIAVGAPMNFFTDWIAVQVAVCGSAYQDTILGQE